MFLLKRLAVFKHVIDGLIIVLSLIILFSTYPYWTLLAKSIKHQNYLTQNVAKPR